jgi:integrase
MPAGIDPRHRRTCPGPRPDGKCCAASWQAHVYDARTGKRIRRTFATRTAAKLWRADAIAALRAGDLAAVTPTGRTVRDALDALTAGMADGTILDRSGRRYRPATIRGYRDDIAKHLAPKLGHLRLGEVRRGDVQRLVDELHASGLSGSTVRNKLDPLRVVYRRALQDDEVTRNPAEKLRLPALAPKARRIADPARVGALLDALPPGERAAWSTAFYAGLRVGELRALRWHHVDFDAGLIRVAAGWDDQAGEQATKTIAGTRTVPLVGRLRADLARHKLAAGQGADALCFGRTPNSAFIRSTLRSRALAAWARAGLDALTPHEARHTCASYLAAAGLTPKEAQTAMGHADIRTTMNIYAHAVPGWEQGAAAKLDAYLDAPGAGAGTGS